MEPRLVSIIIPCYNYGWLLAETLDSVLAQTHQDWECLIVDDGSTDNTRSVANEYANRDHRFTYVYQKNQGLSAARNTGIANANGEFIQFLDADDLLATQKLSKQVEYLSSQSNIDLVYGSVRYFQSDTPLVLSLSFDMSDKAWMPQVSGKGEELLNALLKQNIMVVNAPLVRSSFVHQVGDFNTSLTCLEDWDFWLRGAINGAAYAYQDDDNVLAYVRVHRTSMSQNRLRMQTNEIQIRRKINKLLKWSAKDESTTNRLVMLNQQIINSQAIETISNGKFWEGAKLFILLGHERGDYFRQFKNITYWFARRIKKLR